MSYTGMIPYTLPSMLTAFKPDKETVSPHATHAKMPDSILHRRTDQTQTEPAASIYQNDSFR